VPTFNAADGTRLHYTVEGSGPHLVCQPGGPGRAAAYLEDLGGLTGTRTVVRLDARATGGSEVPADPASLAFPRLADDLVALLDHLGLDRADVLGHSAGAIVLQALAAQHAGRLRRLVLVTPSSRLQAPDFPDVGAIRAARSGEPWYAEAVEAAEALAEGMPGAVTQQLVRQTRPFFYGRWDERQQAHAATADSQSSRRAELGFRQAGGTDTAGLLAALRVVTAPVLVVAGERDGLTGVTSAHRVAGSFPDARVAVLTGAGHFPWVDEPQAFREVVEEFLAE
jgi:proline iminopeptidase